MRIVGVAAGLGGGGLGGEGFRSRRRRARRRERSSPIATSTHRRRRRGAALVPRAEKRGRTRPPLPCRRAMHHRRVAPALPRPGMLSAATSPACVLAPRPANGCAVAPARDGSRCDARSATACRRRSSAAHLSARGCPFSPREATNREVELTPAEASRQPRHHFLPPRLWWSARCGACAWRFLMVFLVVLGGSRGWRCRR